jgi:hypothetical protein
LFLQFSLSLCKAALYPAVAVEIEREKEATRQRIEAERVTAAEQERLREESARNDRLKDEQNRRLREELEKYRSAPTGADDALRALKKLEARTEISVTKAGFSEALGVAWGDVKVFVESREGEKYALLSKHLKDAVDTYKAAQSAWELGKTWGDHTRIGELQWWWRKASLEIRAADALINRPDTYPKLKAAMEAEWKADMERQARDEQRKREQAAKDAAEADRFHFSRDGSGYFE